MWERPGHGGSCGKDAGEDIGMSEVVGRMWVWVRSEESGRKMVTVTLMWHIC